MTETDGGAVESGARPETVVTSAAGHLPQAAADPIRFTATDRLVVLGDPRSEWAESVGALRTHVMAQHLAAGRRALALVSPTADVGCAALAANLAVALAESGIRTLLIDTDMREPTLHDFIAPGRDVPGLRQCLSDATVHPGDAIQFDALPSLSLLYAGGAAERPQELLAGARFQDLVDSCLREFPVTIAITPPAASSADARRVATVMGYALLVAACDRTFVSDMRVLAEELTADHAIVIGSVLNRP